MNGQWTCHQRGCTFDQDSVLVHVPDGAEDVTEVHALCPVCANPLHYDQLVVLASSDPEGHQQALADAEAERDFGTEGLPPDNGVGSFPS